MQTTARLARLAPLAGLAYAGATIVADLTIGPFPGPGTSISKLTSFYAAHHARVAAGGMITAWGAILLAIFAAALWTRARGGHPLVAAALLLGGAAAVVSEADGASSFWTLGHVSTESGVSPAALQALHVSAAEGGFGVGVAVLLLAVGAAGVLPRWLAWPAVALGLLQLTPLGFAASLLFLLWSAAAGIVLVREKEPKIVRAEDDAVAAAA